MPYRALFSTALAVFLLAACGGDDEAGLPDESHDGGSIDEPSVDMLDRSVDDRVETSREDVSDAPSSDGGLDSDRESSPDAARDAPDATTGDTIADQVDATIDSNDAATDPGDGGFVPAAHPPLPQLQFHGGPILANPKLTAVTYDNFDQRALVDDVVSNIGSSGAAFWTPALAEYGVGPATATAPVHIAGLAPMTIDDLAIQTWLVSQLDGTHAAFGTPTNESLYVIFFPSTTVITNATLHSCQAFGGYHGNLYLQSGPFTGVNIAYAVVAECSDAFTLEAAASHEIVEACNDPYGLTTVPGVAWAGVDSDHLVWGQVLGGDESADLCQLLFASKFIPFPYTHAIQRTWSNAAANANRDPCATASAFAYFNAAPVLPDTVTIKEGGTTHLTKGVLIPLSQSRTIEVDLYSESDIGSWTVTATDLSPVAGGGAGPNLTFSWDSPTGRNGSKLHLTITALAGTPKLGGEPFMLTSSNGGPKHEWIGYVAQN